MSLYIRFGSRLLSSHCLLPVLHLPPVLSPSALPCLLFLRCHKHIYQYDIFRCHFCGLMSLLLLYMYFQSCWLYTRSDHPVRCSRSMSASVLCLPHCHLLLYMSLYIRFGSRLLSSHCLLPVLHFSHMKYHFHYLQLLND